MEYTELELIESRKWAEQLNRILHNDSEVVEDIDPSISTEFEMPVTVYDKVHEQSKLVGVTAKDSKTLLTGEKEVALSYGKPEQGPRPYMGSRLVFPFPGRITNHENAAAHFDAIHLLDCHIENPKDTRATKKTLVGPSSSNNCILNIGDPVSTGHAETVGYASANVPDSAPEHVVDMPSTEDDVGTSDSATGSRSSNSGAKAQVGKILSEFRDSHSNELGYWARVLDGVTRAAAMATRAADLATRAADLATRVARLATTAARLASLAGSAGTCVRVLIAEMAEIFN